MYQYSGASTRLRLMLAATLSVCLALQGGMTAQAATVSSAGGDGLLNSGNGFKKFVNGDVGRRGEIVLSNASDVTVLYENGCVVVVKPGVPYTIETPETCLTASATGLTPQGLLTGAAIAGGIAAAVIIAGNSGSASP